MENSFFIFLLTILPTVTLVELLIFFNFFGLIKNFIKKTRDDLIFLSSSDTELHKKQEIVIQNSLRSIFLSLKIFLVFVVVAIISLSIYFISFYLIFSEDFSEILLSLFYWKVQLFFFCNGVIYAFIKK